MNISTARRALNGLIEQWRAQGGAPVYIGPYGSPEAVLSPLTVWHRLLDRVAELWDEQTALVRAARLDDPAGPGVTTLGELGRLAGCAELPVPVVQTRGVPRGAASLAVWPAAVDDLRKLSLMARENTPVAALRALSQVLQAKAKRAESRCGRGTVYTVADVDGLHAAVLTTRAVARPAGRRGGGGYETVELVGVDHIRW